MTRPPALPDLDEDGNPLAVPDPLSDVGQLIYLLEWARIRGFRLGPWVKLGALTMSVVDLRQTEGVRDRDDTSDPGPWAAAGFPEGDQ